MRATIDVGEMIALVVHQQRLELPPAAPHGEFFALAMRELTDGADKFTRRFFRCSHDRLSLFNRRALSNRPPGSRPKHHPDPRAPVDGTATGLCTVRRCIRRWQSHRAPRECNTARIGG